MEEVQTVSNVDVKEKTERPSKYKVILFNDDTTTMEFVIQVLLQIFKHDMTSAEKVMLDIHNNGNGIAGVYYYEIAEQKLNDTLVMARNKGFPLRGSLDKE